MRRSSWMRMSPIALAAIACAIPTRARAEEASTEMPMSWVMKTEVKGGEVVNETRGPNHRYLTYGLVGFGVGYGLAAIVGATSPRDEDRRMLLPLFGPWLALADRGDCGREITDKPCTREGTYKVLIVADGLLQLAGAASIVAAFVYPETRYETKTIDVSGRVRVMPTPMGQGVGLVASGWF